MVREVISAKSSLPVAKRIYTNELKTVNYPSKETLLTNQRIVGKWMRDEESILSPEEKSKRMQKFMQSLKDRQGNAQPKESKRNRKRLPYNEADPRANRLETIFSIYADQSTESYRMAAKRKNFLPPLPQILKILNNSRRRREKKLCADEDNLSNYEMQRTILPKVIENRVL